MLEEAPWNRIGPNPGGATDDGDQQADFIPRLAVNRKLQRHALSSVVGKLRCTWDQGYHVGSR